MDSAYRAWILSTEKSALVPWQAAQASAKGAVFVKAWAAVDSLSWQLRQADPMGSMGL
jgi:hypothetical protein